MVWSKPIIDPSTKIRVEDKKGLKFACKRFQDTMSPPESPFEFVPQDSQSRNSFTNSIIYNYFFTLYKN
jgi:hypothetical protein